MTKAKAAASKAPRRKRNWKTLFLAHLAETSNVSASARKAGVTTSFIYTLRRDDPGFADQWFAALCEGYDNLEMDLLHRLRSGDLDKPGAKSRRKFENATATRILAAHRQTVSRLKARQQDNSEDDIIASINARIDAMRERDEALARLVEDDNATPAKTI